MLKRLLFLFALLALVLSLSVSVGYAQATTPTIQIIPANPSLNFPEIRLDAVVMVNDQPLQGLTTSNFTVTDVIEPDSLTVQTVSDVQPLTLVVIVDLSQSGNLDLIKQNLHAYFGEFYRPGDQVTILVHSTHQAQVNTFTSGDQRDAIHALIDSLQLGAAPVRLHEGLQRALNLLEGARNSPRAVLLVSSYLNDCTVRAFADDFTALHVPLNVAQAVRGRNNGESAECYNDLTAGNGGIRVENSISTLLTSPVQTGGYTALSGLRNLYTAMDSARIAYRITYRTISQDTNSERNFQLTVSAEGTNSANYSYTPVFQPPTVEIVSPTNISPARNYVGDPRNPSLDTESLPIIVRVTFPDNIQRPLQVARLEITNPSTNGELQAPVVQVTPSLSGTGELTFTWDLRGYDEPDKSTPVNLTIHVTDSRGMESEATITGSVIVGPVPIAPTYTPLPTHTIAPTYTPQPTEAPLVDLTPIGVRAEDSNFFVLVGSSLINILLLISVVAIIAYFTLTKRGRGAVQAVTERVRTEVVRVKTEILGIGTEVGGVESPMPTPPMMVYGELLVENGDLLVSSFPLDRRLNSFGRERESGVDENHIISLPFVSGKHFMIHVEPDNQFTFENCESETSTIVDNARLQKRQIVEIRDGSTIRIGHRDKLLVLRLSVTDVGGYASKKTEYIDEELYEPSPTYNVDPTPARRDPAPTSPGFGDINPMFLDTLHGNRSNKNNSAKHDENDVDLDSDNYMDDYFKKK